MASTPRRWPSLRMLRPSSPASSARARAASITVARSRVRRRRGGTVLLLEDDDGGPWVPEPRSDGASGPSSGTAVDNTYTVVLRWCTYSVSNRLTSIGDPMEAVVRRAYGSHEVIRVEAVPRPTPGPGQVLIEVRAAAISPLDWHFMRGEPRAMRLQTGLRAPKDPRMGQDLAGVVVELGEGVTRWKVGDEVL